MVTAVDGMLKDRGNIISSHICMIALLELSVVGTNMVVMDCNMGYLCSAIVFASMMYCYHRCLQKYNRFKVKQDFTNSIQTVHMELSCLHAIFYLSVDLHGSTEVGRGFLSASVV